MKSCPHCGASYKPVKSQAYCSLSCALWSRVDRRGVDECWPWTGPVGSHGYGAFSFSGELRTSHTAVAALETGRTGRVGSAYLVAMHSCDNRRCCNPSHISVAPQKVNLADARAKGRMPHTPPRGEKTRTAVLCEADVRKIRASSDTNKALSQKYGITPSGIWRVRSRKTWKHI